MRIENKKFFVVSLGTENEIVENREKAIQTLKTLVMKLPKNTNIETMKPEIIEVDTSGEKWSLKGLAWNQIAIELMRENK